MLPNYHLPLICIDILHVLRPAIQCTALWEEWARLSNCFILDIIRDEYNDIK